MNNQHYVGQRISNFELYNALQPISGVSLHLAEDTKPINVGDDTGYVLDVYCPYGTEQMAENILSRLRGRVYKGFRAGNAVLSPTAELGDGLQVNGDYYMLAYRSVTFGPGHMSEIAAPGENELEHEYVWENPEKREFNRQLADARSEIAKTNEKIDLGIYGPEGSFTKLNLSLGNLSAEVHGADGKGGLAGAVTKLNLSLGELTAKVTGTGGLSDQYSALSLKMNQLKLSVSSKDGEVSISLNSGDSSMGSGTIDLTGMVTFSALNNAPGTGVTKINGGWIDAETLNVKAANISGQLNVDKINMKGNISWDFLDATTQKTIEDAAKSGGHTDRQIRTLINDRLVSSPTIAGGVFQDEPEMADAALYLDREYEDDELVNAGVVLERKTYYYDRYGKKEKRKRTLQTLQIWDDGFDSVALSSRKNMFLHLTGGQEMRAYGLWVFNGTVDFSKANVIGL